MSLRGGLVLGVLGVLAAGCGLVPGTEERAHRRAVDDLSQRAASEQGWHVVEVPNLHEGGGSTTWWMHPCDPERDTRRDVTRTAYHGSDVAGLPGRHVVDETTVACEAPSREVVLDDGRTLRLDVSVLPLGRGRLGVLAGRDEIVVTDVDHGVSRQVRVLAGTPVEGPCDGRTSWSARLESRSELSVAARSCAGTLAALPLEARELIGLAGDELGRSTTRLRPGDVEAFDDALVAAGWESDTVVSHGFEGSGTDPYWRGPCAAGYEADGATRTVADWYDGRLSVRERHCE